MITLIVNTPAIDPVTTDMAMMERRADTFVRFDLFPAIRVPAGPRTFSDEKQAFLSMLPLLYARYRGEYVAISGGEIVDHDPSRLGLARRLFTSPEARRMSVYIGLVGRRDVARIPTPFVRRQP